jgi:hypothetical protein
MVAFVERVPHKTPSRSYAHSNMEPYTITKVVGENYFELSIPPFLGLHPVFNVELL